MKKNIKLFVCVFVMIFALAGVTACGNKSDNGKKESESKEDDTSDDERDTDDERETYDEKETYDDEIQSDISDWVKYYGVGYSFKISPDWKETDNESAEVSFIHTRTAADGFIENISVATQDTSVYDMDLEDYLEVSLKQYETLGYDVLECDSMIVNGVEGYYCETTTEVESVDCYLSQYFTIIDGTAYIFTFAGDIDGYYELKDEVKDIYRTIEFE